MSGRWHSRHGSANRARRERAVIGGELLPRGEEQDRHHDRDHDDVGETEPRRAATRFTQPPCHPALARSLAERAAARGALAGNPNSPRNSRPVSERAAAATLSGGPAATTRPPSSPPPGPRSIT